MSSKYSYGAALEYRVRDHFEREGYYVMRSAGSGGVADLVALDMYVPAPPVMIQVKRVKGTMSVDAWNHLLRTANAVGAVALLAVEHPTKPLVYSLQRITAPRRPRRQATPDQWESWTLRTAEEREPSLVGLSTTEIEGPVVRLDNTEAVFTLDPIGPTTRIPGPNARCGREMAERVPCSVHRPEAFEPGHLDGSTP